MDSLLDSNICPINNWNINNNKIFTSKFLIHLLVIHMIINIRNNTIFEVNLIRNKITI